MTGLLHNKREKNEEGEVYIHIKCDPLGVLVDTKSQELCTA